jgi:hypothetical protein
LTFSFNVDTIRSLNKQGMSDQELCDELDSLVENHMDYISNQITELTQNGCDFDAVSLVEEYMEFYKKNDGIELISINFETGDINEYTLEQD